MRGRDRGSDGEGASESTRESNRGGSASDRDDGGQGSGADAASGSVATLHRTVGNGALQRLDRSGDLQASLAVSQPKDPQEREAERVAEEVVGSPPSGSTGTRGRVAGGDAADGDGGGDTSGRGVRSSKGARNGRIAPPSGEAPRRRSQSTGRLQRSTTAGDGGGGPDPEARVETATGGGGKPLDAGTRSYFEPRFGQDFSDVSVHTGSRADEAARSIGAEAFTMGSDIAFSKGSYEPSTSSGKELIAHELTHVVQQGGAGERVQRKPADSGTERTETTSESSGSGQGGVVQVGPIEWDPTGPLEEGKPFAAMESTAISHMIDLAAKLREEPMDLQGTSSDDDVTSVAGYTEKRDELADRSDPKNPVELAKEYAAYDARVEIAERYGAFSVRYAGQCAGVLGRAVGSGEPATLADREPPTPAQYASGGETVYVPGETGGEVAPIEAYRAYMSRFAKNLNGLHLKRATAEMTAAKREQRTERAKLVQRADKLWEATLNSNVSTDERAILEAVMGLEAVEGAAVRELYARRSGAEGGDGEGRPGRSLENVIKNEEGEGLYAAVEQYLSGDQYGGAEKTLEYVGSIGDEMGVAEEAIAIDAVRNFRKEGDSGGSGTSKTERVGELQDLASESGARNATESYFGINTDETDKLDALTDPELSDEQATARADAVDLYDAMKGGTGSGTYESTVYEVLEKRADGSDQQVLEEQYEAYAGQALRAALGEEFEGAPLDRAIALLDCDGGAARAAKLKTTSGTLSDDEGSALDAVTNRESRGSGGDWLEKQRKVGAEREEMAEMKRVFEEKYADDYDSMQDFIESVHGGEESVLDEAMMARFREGKTGKSAESGPTGAVYTLLYAIEGAGTEDRRVLEALRTIRDSGNPGDHWNRLVELAKERHEEIRSSDDLEDWLGINQGEGARAEWQDNEIGDELGGETAFKAERLSDQITNKATGREGSVEAMYDLATQDYEYYTSDTGLFGATSTSNERVEEAWTRIQELHDTMDEWAKMPEDSSWHTVPREGEEARFEEFEEMCSVLAEYGAMWDEQRSAVSDTVGSAVMVAIATAATVATIGGSAPAWVAVVGQLAGGAAKMAIQGAGKGGAYGQQEAYSVAGTAIASAVAAGIAVGPLNAWAEGLKANAALWQNTFSRYWRLFAAEFGMGSPDIVAGLLTSEKFWSGDDMGQQLSLALFVNGIVASGGALTGDYVQELVGNNTESVFLKFAAKGGAEGAFNKAFESMTMRLVEEQGPASDVFWDVTVAALGGAAQQLAIVGLRRKAVEQVGQSIDGGSYGFADRAADGGLERGKALRYVVDNLSAKRKAKLVSDIENLENGMSRARARSLYRAFGGRGDLLGNVDWPFDVDQSADFVPVEDPIRAVELARKTGTVLSGTNESADAVRGGDAELLVVADDAPADVVSGVREAAEGRGIPVVSVDRGSDLGTAAGIDVGAASATIVDSGAADLQPLGASAGAGGSSGGGQTVQPRAAQGAAPGSVAAAGPRDAAEREADRVAARVVGSRGPLDGGERPVGVHRRASGAGVRVGGDFGSDLGTGDPIPRTERRFFESRFGRDFGDVRVHTGPSADAAARSLGAAAFAMGTDVAFRSGAYDPAGDNGRELLAHELAHVVQQGWVRPRAAAGDAGTTASTVPGTTGAGGPGSVRSRPLVEFGGSDDDPLSGGPAAGPTDGDGGDAEEGPDEGSVPVGNVPALAGGVTSGDRTGRGTPGTPATTGSLLADALAGVDDPEEARLLLVEAHYRARGHLPRSGAEVREWIRSAVRGVEWDELAATVGGDGNEAFTPEAFRSPDEGLVANHHRYGAFADVYREVGGMAVGRSR